jgi:hypothetical protein
MRETIYKFLDGYVGGGVQAKRLVSSFMTYQDHYEILSDNGVQILLFSVSGERMKIYRSEGLCKKLCSYLSLEKEDAWKYVRDWFGQRYHMKKVSDLLNFIST